LHTSRDPNSSGGGKLEEIKNNLPVTPQEGSLKWR
jgi:hypothetical protein